VMSSFRDYSTDTPFSAFNWKNVTADGVPMVGSTGSFNVRIFQATENKGLANRILVVRRWLRGTQNASQTDSLGP
jgi:hypothetical protein